MEKKEKIIDEKEVEEVITEKENKGSYITGIIGGILGGVLGAVPWIFVLSFANMIAAILTLAIAWSVYGGYKLFKGKKSKLVPLIIVIISIAVIIISITVVLPIIGMIKADGVVLSFENFMTLYKSNQFVNSMTIDLIISSIFTVAGIFSIIKVAATDVGESVKKSIIITIIIAFICTGLTIGGIYLYKNNAQNDKSSNYEYTLEGTNIKFKISPDMTLYAGKDQLGEELYQMYDAIIITNDKKFKIDISLLNKTLLNEEHSIDEIIKLDCDSIKEYGYETSEVVNEKIGNIDFKSYSYSYEYMSEKFINYSFITDVNDNFLFIDVTSSEADAEMVLPTLRKILE